MIFAVDVDYREGKAVAAGIAFNDWADHVPANTFIAQTDQVEEYQPGEFYKRELPIILLLLAQLPQLPQMIVIDGYVYLDRYQKAGLGIHLYNSLDKKVAIIGVAKSRFQDIPSETEVLRSDSNRPLFVTAIGIDESEARGYIKKMHGNHRLPTILKAVDRLCRDSYL
ncbi:endonuclease V [Pseudanabaena galeata UHCC 0370]|uniref:Endonuclease V n=1 Tax=Pseudanabaena galeata UHCC 0370 TaxID=3110310 RepID=A0ABU5TFS6_9CYAN|nr:endonuclease V [Pseudanabaena galeata]MEA5477119.1 endonuclease V [Pseudanabaena galeata UHCC 0370]